MAACCCSSGVIPVGPRPSPLPELPGKFIAEFVFGGLKGCSFEDAQGLVAGVWVLYSLKFFGRIGDGGAGARGDRGAEILGYSVNLR